MLKSRRLPASLWLATVLLCGICPLFAANLKILPGHVPAIVSALTPKGELPPTNQLHLAIGLPLRNGAELDEFLHQLYDPASTNFHKFLTPEEFAARFGPTEAGYQAVIQFAERNGFTVDGTHPNRMVLDVDASVASIERAFQINLRIYPHPTEPRTFYAPDVEPSVDAGVPVLSVSGLDNFALPHPKHVVSEKMNAAGVTPKSGSGSSGSYAGNDFRAAYVPGVTLNGSGQSVALLEFDGYYSSDIASYENSFGLPSVTLSNVAVDGGVSSPGSGNSEVALDIEMAVAMAPGLSTVIIYEAPNPSPWPDLLNRIANDNSARQISCSWGGGSPDPTSEQIFKQMAAQGQSFFNASGDSDAFTGSIPFPSDSTNITQVGGTTLTTTGPGGSWSSETVWNWGASKGKYTGSSGGISTYYSIPSWQSGISMIANHGSTTMRNVPDVALTADNILVYYNHGQAAIFGGTSCAAPLWAAFTALVNQQAATAGQPPVGFVNPGVYAIGKGTNYLGDFHDITTGNNFTRNSPANFPAVAGYDLCTGWGTPNGTNLINALAPSPYFVSQPSNQTVTNGASVTFSASASGSSPLGFQWRFNGTNLSAGGNVSGITSNVLSIAAAATNNAGGYSLVVANGFGSVTSRVAVLSVGFPPVIFTPPTNQTILSGSNAVFSASVGGSLPLTFQWQKNGANLANGAGISGATSNVLTLTAVATNSAGNYRLSVTNIFGGATSSAAVLAVVLPPAIMSSSLTNRTLECGSNISYSVAASGTVPLAIQWSLDGSPVFGATNSSLAFTNVYL
ncbi:MAG TPA: protease pro-enzyme activation domain-containing protein, partial [Verrucomicrobiae bacterium]